MMLLACLLLIGVMCLARWLERSWHTPGVLFSLFWSFAAIPACVSQLPVAPIAVFVIAMFGFVVAIGSAIGLAGSSPQTAASGSDATAPPLAKFTTESRHELLRLAVLGLGGAGLLVPPLLMLSEGRSIEQLASASEWLKFAAEITVARYRTDYAEPLLVRALMTATYLGSLVAGLLLRVRRGRVDWWLALLPVFAASAASIATTAKATFLLAGVLTASSYLATSFLTERAAGRAPRLRAMLRWSLLGIAALVLFVGSMIMRYQSDRPDVVGFLLDRLSTYAFGHMSAFSAWLESDAFAGDELTFGAYTFAGPASVLGFFERTVGIYSELTYNDYTVESNVFTVFRGLISDAGFAGALAFVGFAAFLAGRAVCQLRAGRAHVSSIAILTTFYAVTLWSHVISIFTYNSLAVALVTFAIICRLVLHPAADSPRALNVSALHGE